MIDLLGDIADDDEGADGDKAADKLQPEDAGIFEQIANREDDILFGNPRGLENFREMKQAAIDPLYKDGGNFPKGSTALPFNLQMLMLKARHGWSDTSFNDLLRLLADQFPE